MLAWHADDAFRIIWDMMMMALLGVIAILLPVELAFDKGGDIRSGWGISALLIDLVFTAVRFLCFLPLSGSASSSAFVFVDPNQGSRWSTARVMHSAAVQGLSIVIGIAHEVAEHCVHRLGCCSTCGVDGKLEGLDCRACPVQTCTWGLRRASSHTVAAHLAE